MNQVSTKVSTKVKSQITCSVTGFVLDRTTFVHHDLFLIYFDSYPFSRCAPGVEGKYQRGQSSTGTLLDLAVLDD